MARLESFGWCPLQKTAKVTMVFGEGEDNDLQKFLGLFPDRMLARYNAFEKGGDVRELLEDLAGRMISIPHYNPRPSTNRGELIADQDISFVGRVTVTIGGLDYFIIKARQILEAAKKAEGVA